MVAGDHKLLISQLKLEGESYKSLLGDIVLMLPLFELVARTRCVQGWGVFTGLLERITNF